MEIIKVTFDSVVEGLVWNGVEVETTICIDPESRYGGWYELFDKVTEGEWLHLEGVLEIDFNNEQPKLTGYDGCFELPDYVFDKLETLNIDVNEVRI